MMRQTFKPLLAFSAVVVIAWAVSPILVRYLFGAPDSGGTFGDSYGAVNALFSGLALAGVVFALVLQQKQLAVQQDELKEQRKELALTRGELKRSAEAQIESQKALEAQVVASRQTARLRALEAVVTHLDLKIGTSGPVAEQQRLRARKLELVDMLEAELRSLTTLIDPEEIG